MSLSQTGHLRTAHSALDVNLRISRTTVNFNTDHFHAKGITPAAYPYPVFTTKKTLPKSQPLSLRVCSATQPGILHQKECMCYPTSDCPEIVLPKQAQHQLCAQSSGDMPDTKPKGAAKARPTAAPSWTYVCCNMQASLKQKNPQYVYIYSIWRASSQCRVHEQYMDTTGNLIEPR